MPDGSGPIRAPSVVPDASTVRLSIGTDPREELKGPGGVDRVGAASYLALHGSNERDRYLSASSGSARVLCARAVA